MSAQTVRCAVPDAAVRTPAGIVRRAENSLLAAVLLILVALPLAEAILRRLIHAGIPGSAALVQHLTLIATMVGAVVAARDREAAYPV